MTGTRTDAVVVPAVSIPSTLACIRSLGRQGVHTVVASESPSASAISSAYCDEAVSVPDPQTDLSGYTEALLGLARREDVRTIVPVREVDAYVLAKYRETFADHVATPWVDFETLRRVQDRLHLAEVAEAADVPVPETRLAGAVEDWSGRSVVKSRYSLLVDEYVDDVPPGRTGENKTIEHLADGTVPDVARLREEFGHEPIVQEFVPITDEYMVGALYDRGEPLVTFQHDQIRGTSYTHGGGVYRESVHDPDLEAAARDLLDALDWHGLACIEYMRDPETGEFKLAEINPRMWMSLAANVNMGADFPLYYWQLATGRRDRIDPTYDRGVGSHHLQGELSYLASLFTEESSLVDRPSLPGTLREMATSCLRHPQFDVLSLEDPRPFVVDVARLFDANVPVGPAVADRAARLLRREEPVPWRDAATTPPDRELDGTDPSAALDGVDTGLDDHRGHADGGTPRGPDPDRSGHDRQATADDRARPTRLATTGVALAAAAAWVWWRARADG